MANIFGPEKGLSTLQRRILSTARKHGGTVLARDILMEFYGFHSTCNTAESKESALMFDRASIGKARYNAATVATCKAFNRLVARGMAHRIMSGIRIKHP